MKNTNLEKRIKKKKERCALCLKLINGTVFYVDKYPHHCLCKKKVLLYLKGKNNK